MLYFRAEYDDRKLILEAGAKWDFKKFCWCVENRADYKNFRRWVKAKVFSDTLYFLEAKDECPYCGKTVKQVAIACGEYFEDGKVYGGDCINVMSGLEFIGKEIGGWLRANYPVRKRYFPAYGYRYLSNGCGACDGILSDDYLFDRVESIFDIDSPEKAEKLIVKKAKFNYDVPLGGFVRWAFPAENFKNCKVEEADLIIF